MRKRLSRPQLLYAVALAMLAPQEPLARAPAGGGRFLNRRELALLDELTEMILPAYPRSPGARAARVAAQIDATLAATGAREQRLFWRRGLLHVDRLSRRINGRPFLRAAAGRRLAVLLRMAGDAGEPGKFFRTLKRRTIQSCYQGTNSSKERRLGRLANQSDRARASRRA